MDGNKNPGYGYTIVDGFMTFKDVERDLEGVLTSEEIGRSAANAMLGEVEAAQHTLREKQAELQATQHGGRVEAR